MKISSDFLPEEIVFDILTRLPVKSLCRFKCVSKSWLSTISTPNFVDSHFNRSRSHPELLISIWTKDGEAFRQSLFIADREETEQEKKGPLVLTHQTTLRVKEVPVRQSLTVAGLTLSIDSRDQIVITNPSTKASVAFPQAFPKRYDHYRSVCFGYDSLNDKHKIVESQACMGSIEEHSIVSLSDSGNWRSVKGPSVRYLPEEQCCVDGVIYYAAWSMELQKEFCVWIVAFDLRSEKFQMAELSINGRLSLSDPQNPCRYIAFEGKLAIVDYPYSNKVGDYEVATNELVAVGVPALDLWVMEDFEDQVWSLRSYCLPPSFTRTSILIGTTFDDGELIFVEFGNKDKPLPIGSHYDKFINLPDRDVPFSFSFFNLKTGIFRSKEVRLPPGYHLTGNVAISAASLVGRL